MNPSQEPAQPQPPSPPPVDPTAEPPLGAGRPAGDPTRPAGLGVPGAAPQFAAPGQAGGSDAGSGPADGRGAGYRPADGPGAGYRPADWAGTDYRPADASVPTSGQGGAAGAGPGYEAGAAGDGGYGLAHPSGPDFYGLAAGGYVDARPDWPVRVRTRRPWRRTAAVTVLTAVVIMALGGPLGLLWAWLSPSVPVIDTGANGIVVNDPSPEEYIAADGWYALLGLAFGLLVAILAWLLLRRDRGPFLLLGVVLGTLGAGYLVAPRVGEMIGRDAYAHWRETAAQGATYLAPPELHSVGPTLVPAFAAAIVLTLLAGWSNDPDLEQPGAKPGYGPNAVAPPAAGGPLSDPAGAGLGPAGGPVTSGPVADGPLAGRPGVGGPTVGSGWPRPPESAGS